MARNVLYPQSVGQKALDKFLNKTLPQIAELKMQQKKDKKDQEWRESEAKRHQDNILENRKIAEENTLHEREQRNINFVQNLGVSTERAYEDGKYGLARSLWERQNKFVKTSNLDPDIYGLGPEYGNKLDTRVKWEADIGSRMLNLGFAKNIDSVNEDVTYIIKNQEHFTKKELKDFTDFMAKDTTRSNHLFSSWSPDITDKALKNSEKYSRTVLATGISGLSRTEKDDIIGLIPFEYQAEPTDTSPVGYKQTRENLMLTAYRETYGGLEDEKKAADDYWSYTINQYGDEGLNKYLLSMKESGNIALVDNFIEKLGVVAMKSGKTVNGKIVQLQSAEEIDKTLIEKYGIDAKLIEYEKPKDPPTPVYSASAKRALDINERLEVDEDTLKMVTGDRDRLKKLYDKYLMTVEEEEEYNTLLNKYNLEVGINLENIDKKFKKLTDRISDRVSSTKKKKTAWGNLSKQEGGLRKYFIMFPDEGDWRELITPKQKVEYERQRIQSETYRPSAIRPQE